MRRSALLVLVATTALAIGLYGAGLPVVGEVEGWFYPSVDKDVGLVQAALVTAAIVPWLVRWALRLGAKGRHVTATMLLVTASWSAQLGMSALGGAEEIWERHALGHAEFYPVAVARHDRMLDTLRSYDDLAAQRQLSNFGPSKPPGALLCYMVTAAVGELAWVQDLLEPVIENARRDPRVRGHAAAAAVSAFTWPLLTALAIVPLIWLGRRLFGSDAAGYGAAVLYLTAPSVLLIAYHLDGAVFPWFAVACSALSVAALVRDHFRLSFAAGLVGAAGLYFSFSLVPAIGLALGAMVLVAWERRIRLPLLMAHAVAFALGTGAVLGGLRGVLDFHLLESLPVALDYHEAWKEPVPTELWRWMSVVEFALYAGLPLVALWLARAGSGLIALVRHDRSAEHTAPLALVLALGALAAVGGTNEVARIWLFLVPFIAVVVAASLPRLHRDGRWGVPLGWIAAAQALVAVVMKGTQVW